MIRKYLLSLLILVVAATIINADNTTATKPEVKQEHVERYIERVEQQRVLAAATVEQRIQGTLQLPHRRAKDRRIRRELLAKHRQELAKLQDPSAPYRGKMSLSAARVGDIGYVNDGRPFIRQKIDHQIAIIEVISTGHTTRVYATQSGGSYQQKAVNIPHPVTKQLILQGVDLTDKADKDNLDDLLYGQCFYVSGTRAYSTVLGARKTLPVIQPVDIRKHLEQ